MKKLMMIVLAAMLAGCESAVDPEKVRVNLGPPSKVQRDDITVTGMYAEPVLADPGGKLALAFEIRNDVRDAVFLELSESTAYVASMMAFAPGETLGQMYPGAAPTVNPDPAAAPYRFLRAAKEKDGRTLKVELPVTLPPMEWEKVEMTVVFSAHGYTRETRGEFRDTQRKVVVVNRKTPATRGAGAGPVPGGGGLIYRPATTSAPARR